MNRGNQQGQKLQRYVVRIHVEDGSESGFYYLCTVSAPLHSAAIEIARIQQNLSDTCVLVAKLCYHQNER